MAWNRPTSNTVDATSSSRPVGATVVIVLCALCLAALGVGAYFLFSGGEKPQNAVAQKKPSVIMEVTPAPAPTNVVVAAEDPQEDPEKAALRAKLKGMTPQERMDYLFERMKNTPIDFAAKTNRPFATGVEQVISSIFMTRLGDLPPPTPGIPIRDELHLAEILIANNPALEGDSERVKEAKAVVEAAKKELRQYIKEGGDIKDFLEYYRGQLVQANMEWRESQKSVMRVIREDPGIAVDYVKAVNKRLAEKGIKPIMLNSRAKDKIGWTDD